MNSGGGGVQVSRPITRQLGGCLSLLRGLVGQHRLGTPEPGQEKGDIRLAWGGTGTIGKGLGEEGDHAGTWLGFSENEGEQVWSKGYRVGIC